MSKLALVVLGFFRGRWFWWIIEWFRSWRKWFIWRWGTR